MKVLMTTDAVGGVFTYCVQLGASLASLSTQVLLASMGRRLSDAQRNEARVAGVSVIESDYRLEWMDDPWLDVERAGEWLLELEDRYQPDLVHVNGYAHAALPWRAPVLLVAHSCVCSWWRAVLEGAAPERYARYRASVSAGLRAARATVAPTAAMLRCLEQEYGTCGRGQVIHNGLDLAPLASAPKQPFVLSAGRVWDPAKNISLLAEAASGLDWPVYVAGDRVGPDDLQAPALPPLRALGFLPREELARWMQQAAIFALPARYEPFGLSILEAAAARCALVLGDIPSLRELWTGAAVFVDPRDPAALRGALAELTRNGARCASLGDLARERAERYGAAAMAQRYADLYRSLLHAGAPRAASSRLSPERSAPSSPAPLHPDLELTP
jgi:glycosyltransferase involved in cell wall biosynthesis